MSTPENGAQSENQSPNYKRDAARVAKILRDGGYTYNQSARLIRLARKDVGLRRSKGTRGTPDRLNREQLDDFVRAAYEHSARRGLMMHTLIDTGMRVASFARLDAEDIDFRDLEIRVVHKGRRRDVPITQALARQLQTYLDGRRTGWVWPSRQGGHLSARRIQQIVDETASDAGISRNVYPHLLRKTIAQRLSDAGMPEEHLQQFLGHEHPETTQEYYRASRTRVKETHKQAMQQVYE